MNHTERTYIWTPRHELAPDVSPGRTMLCPPEPKHPPEPRNPWLVYPEDVPENFTATNPMAVENFKTSTAVVHSPEQEVSS